MHQQYPACYYFGQSAPAPVQHPVQHPVEHQYPVQYPYPSETRSVRHANKMRAFSNQHNSFATSRRSHPKSRLGCKTCKGRKVKCDEQKPQCGNCIKHHVPCDFLQLPDNPSPCPPSSGLDPSGLNLADLELLHNYTLSTASTLSEHPHLRDFYRTTVVTIGLSEGGDYILRTLLSLSALHLARYRAHMRDHYTALATAHHRLASHKAMQLMPEVDARTAPNLWLFSILTIYFAMAAPRKESNFLLVGESGFPDWFFLLHGSKQVIQYFPIEDRRKGPLAPMFQSARVSFTTRMAGAAERRRRKEEMRAAGRQEGMATDTASSSISTPATIASDIGQGPMQWEHQQPPHQQQHHHHHQQQPWATGQGPGIGFGFYEQSSGGMYFNDHDQDPDHEDDEGGFNSALDRLLVLMRRKASERDAFINHTSGAIYTAAMGRGGAISGIPVPGDIGGGFGGEEEMMASPSPPYWNMDAAAPEYPWDNRDPFVLGLNAYHGMEAAAGCGSNNEAASSTSAPTSGADLQTLLPLYEKAIEELRMSFEDLESGQQQNQQQRSQRQPPQQGPQEGSSKYGGGGEDDEYAIPSSGDDVGSSGGGGVPKEKRRRGGGRARKPDMAPASTWLFMVSGDFLSLLREPTQEAAVIVAFFAALLKRLDGHWWMHGWAEHLVSRVYQILDAEHKLWIRWPINEIGWIA